MKIIDLNGCPIEITDLNEAIIMAEDRKDYRHVNKGYENFDKERNAYWTDVYEKLVKIKEQQKNS